MVDVLYVNENKKQWNRWSVAVEEFQPDDIDADRFIPTIDNTELQRKLSKDGYIRKNDMDIRKPIEPQKTTYIDR